MQRWAAHPSRDVSRECNGNSGCVERKYNQFSQDLMSTLERIRDAGRQPGARISESDYQHIGVSLYFLWKEGTGGLSAAQVNQIQNSIGLGSQDANASAGLQSFDEIFTLPIITGLEPDQFAQVFWFTNTGGQHAFLMGRLASGEWFLSDQGPQPAAEFRSSSLTDLQAAVRAAVTSKNYWLYPGTKLDYVNRFGLLPSWTGIKRLAPLTGTETQAQNLIAPGVFLGEVDAGYWTIGNRLTRGAFIARGYILPEVQSQFSNSTGGGLIVEMPQGVFNLYTTSAVSKANVTQTSLDAEDSRGGVLGRRTFYHAWLMLGTENGQHGEWFSLY